MPYAGDISVETCWDRLGNEISSQLVDVRTFAEWTFVGVPALEVVGKKPLFVEWQRYPDMAVNPDFVGQVVSGLDDAGCDHESPVFMLCRSGVRSIAAAEKLTAAGYRAVYNVTAGFEGDTNGDGHRGKLAGWKAADLPWRQ